MADFRELVSQSFQVCPLSKKYDDSLSLWKESIHFFVSLWQVLCLKSVSNCKFQDLIRSLFW